MQRIDAKKWLMHYELTSIQSIFFNHFIQIVFFNLFTLHLYQINITNTKCNYKTIRSIFFLVIIEIIGKRKIFFTFLIHYTTITKVSNKNYFSYLRNRISLEQEEEEEEQRKKENRNTFPRSSRFLETISPKFPPTFHPSLIFLNFLYCSIIQFFPNSQRIIIAEES